MSNAIGSLAPAACITSRKQHLCLDHGGGGVCKVYLHQHIGAWLTLAWRLCRITLDTRRLHRRLVSSSERRLTVSRAKYWCFANGEHNS